jgi:hypothetical protein
MSVVAVSMFVIALSNCDVIGDASAWCVWHCDQYDVTALLAACDNGHLDVARWLVTDAGSDARLERDCVSYRCLCVCDCAFSL